jgi:hypothetical protein
MNSIGGPERVFVNLIFADEHTAMNAGAKMDRVTPR